MRPARNVAAFVLGLLLLALAAPAAAQNGGGDGARAGAQPAERGSALLPGERYFEPPLADPREPRFGGSVVVSDLFSRPVAGRPDLRFRDPADATSDVHAVAAFGGTVPLVRLASWRDGGLSLGLQAGVSARFRMEEYNNDAMSDDWIVALPLEGARGRWAGRLRVLHRSAHLGDEFIEYSGARRITYSYEAVDLLVGYRPHESARLYVGATGGPPSDFVHNTAVQAGLETSWQPRAGTLAFTAGLDAQAADRTDWAAQLSAAAGVSVRRGPRRARLLLRVFDGPSPVGQFFSTDERFWGVELVLE